MKSMTEFEFRQHEEEYNGYCVRCRDITRFGGTEPDAEEYPCEECGKTEVIGMHWALMMGHLIIIERKQNGSRQILGQGKTKVSDNSQAVRSD